MEPRFKIGQLIKPRTTRNSCVGPKCIVMIVDIVPAQDGDPYNEFYYHLLYPPEEASFMSFDGDLPYWGCCYVEEDYEEIK